MERKITIGVILGIMAGIVDVIPMLIQKLTWDANLSAFFMWVAIGFLIATSTLKTKSVLKGIIIAVITIIPTAFLIGWNNPLTLIPIAVMTLILSSLLGYFIEKLQSSEESK